MAVAYYFYENLFVEIVLQIPGDLLILRKLF